MNHKVLIIDLDDTLFSEITYVASGFTEVARLIAEKNNINNKDVFNQIMYQFAKYGRTGTLDRVMSYFRVSVPGIPDLIKAYQEHEPNIKFYYNTEKALGVLRKKFTTIIVTDGFARVQRKKVEALGLENLVDKVIYCMDYNAPKPSVVPYHLIADEFGIDITDMAIIGDDPYNDMIVASDLGILSYRVLQGKYANIDSLASALPNAVFRSFVMVADFLMRDTEYK